MADPIADLELRVQRLEAMRETEKAALLDAFRQIEELKRLLDFHYIKINRLEEQEEPDAFAIVQMRLDDLAGDQELMLYRWPNGEWSIDHTNPTSSVQLGEVSGEYGSTGRTLEEAVCKLAELLPTPEAND